MKEKEALVRTLRVVRGSWKLNGVSLVDLKWFAGESKEKVPLPSRVGTESREGRRGPCSRRSRCSRFIEFKGSVRCNSNRESLYACFSLFVPFALFAVNRIQTECPLWSLGVGEQKKDLPVDQKGSACRSWCERGKNGGGGGNRTRVRKA